MPRVRRQPRQPSDAPARQPRGRLFTDPQAARPLASLVFLSPLLAVYALGLIWVRPDLAARADVLVRQIIAPLGLTGVLAPTWLVVAIMAAWHLVRRDPFRLPAGLLGRMAAETILLVIPLFAMLAVSSVVLHGYFSLAVPGVAPAGWLAVVMTSIGAGIYEELLFRLIMVGVPLWLAHRLLGDKSSGVRVAVVLIAAAVFAGAHTLDDPKQFAWDSFLFRTAAGAYLGYVFALRGFGIAAGVHILFDLIVKLSVLVGVLT